MPPEAPEHWAVVDADGAPRSMRRRKVAWAAVVGFPGLCLVTSGLMSVIGAGNPTGWAVTIAGLTCWLTVLLARNTYGAGYHTGSMQRTIDALDGRDHARVMARPSPHPADPAPRLPRRVVVVTDPEADA